MLFPAINIWLAMWCERMVGKIVDMPGPLVLWGDDFWAAALFSALGICALMLAAHEISVRAEERISRKRCPAQATSLESNDASQS